MVELMIAQTGLIIASWPEIIARTGNFRRANDEASFQNSEAAGALETAMILRKERAFFL